MKYILMILTFLLFIGDLEAANGEEVLLTLAQRARESQSDAVLIVHNGRAIFEYRSDPYWQPIEVMSITKSVVALVIGVLIEEGKIPSIDTPIWHFYPEWRQGNKQLISIRHLLNHTSGLQCDGTTDEIYSCNDIIQLALCAELTSQPGSCFCYNNKAVNLLSGIVEKATGLCLSECASQKLFKPLGIENVSWQCDAAHHDYAMSHLVMNAPDLAKIGDLIARKGRYQGLPIVSSSWIQILTQQGQPHNPFCGSLWWIDYHSVNCCWDDTLLKRYESAGIHRDYIQRLRALQGREIPLTDRLSCPAGDLFFSQMAVECVGGQESAQDFCQQVSWKQLPPARWSVFGPRSIAAYGYLGQQLIVFPDKNVIAVRQMRPKGFTKGNFDESQVDSFPDFGALVLKLIYSQGY